ncbi:MAG: AraC family ligand binding domain-containing protein, partial [Clostridia bacterium]|nr:AraC family ligand binding domain-containing protein [Clostridia bacterium]
MEPKLLTATRFVDTSIGCSYRYVHSDTEYFRPHYHDYYELFLLLEGEATHCINGEQLPLTRGALVFIRPADVHDYLLREGKSFSMLNITFTQDTLDTLFAFLGEGFPSRALLDCRMPPQIRLSEAGLSYILSRMTGIRTIDIHHKEQLKTALRILLFRIFTRFFADFQEAEQPEMPPWLSHLLDEMQRDGNFTYGTERMLALSGKSREHLARSMKKHLGITSSEFVNELRLNFIANMLKNSNHSIADIVFESGFGNLSWAAELFCKKYGTT